MIKDETQGNENEIALSTGLTFKGDDNITSNVDSNGNITYSLNKELKGIKKL